MYNIVSITRSSDVRAHTAKLSGIFLSSVSDLNLEFLYRHTVATEASSVARSLKLSIVDLG